MNKISKRFMSTIAAFTMLFVFLCSNNITVNAATPICKMSEHVPKGTECEWGAYHDFLYIYLVCEKCNYRYEYLERVEPEIFDVYEPTCTSPGTRSFKATYVYEGTEYYAFDTELTAEPLGHDFGEWKYEWADDYKSCTATRKCKRDASHMETYVLKSHLMGKKQIKEPTCTSKGTTRIFALFEDYTRDLETGDYIVPDTYIDVDDIEIDPTAHTGSIVLPKKKDANCVDEGYTGDRIYECCGTVVEKGSSIQAKGHSYDTGEITKVPTCSQKGIKTYTCLVCDDKKNVELGIDSSNHSRETVVKNAVAATCSKEGYSGDTYCKDCDKKIFAGESVKKLEHTWDSGVVTKAPTCNQKGTKTYTCQKCNATKTEDIAVDKTKHTGGTQTKNVVVASCGSTGYTGDVVCIGCGDILKAGNVVDKTQNHKASALVKENVKDADCIHDGSYDNVSYCEVCHKEMSRTKVETKALGHKWVSASIVKTNANNPGTVSQSYVCSVCGATKMESADGTHTHIYEKLVVPATTNSDGKIEWKCGECQDVKSSEIISRVKSVELSVSSFTYNGKNKKPTVTIKDNAGNTIGSDFYTVAYKNNKAVGKATVTITMKGNYSGVYTKTFNIVPAKTSVSKLTAISKGFKVKWKKQTSQVMGYQIQYSTSKSFKNAKQKLIANNKTTSCSIKKLTAGKKYYVRIRTYKLVDGKKIYSGWSAAKTITTGK